MSKLSINRAQILTILALVLNISLLLPSGLSQTGHKDIPYGLSRNEWRKVQKKWKRNRFHVTITTMDDTVHEGQIFDVAEDQLLLWPKASLFLPRQNRGHLIRLDKAQIQSIHIQRKKDVRLATLSGELIGGTGVGLIAAKDKGDWAGIFFIIGAAVGSLPSAVIGGMIGTENETDQQFDLQGDVNTFDTHRTAIQAYALFPNGAPEEIGLDKDDELQQLYSILIASPAMASVFPVRLFNKE